VAVDEADQTSLKREERSNGLNPASDYLGGSEVRGLPVLLNCLGRDRGGLHISRNGLWSVKLHRSPGTCQVDYAHVVDRWE
jgi:hypothetical protein